MPATESDEIEPMSRDGQPLPEPSHESANGSEIADKLDKLVRGQNLGEKAPRIPGGQRGARSAALQALYEEDLTGHSAERALDRLPVFIKLASAHSMRAKQLVRYVTANRHELDERIAKFATEFPVEQIGVVERNLLRMALAELEVGEKPPVAVVVNEAVELAKLFGGESSPKFIHGTLGALLR